MAQHENRWRDEDRDWRDDERWRGEGRSYAAYDRDDHRSAERGMGGRGDLQWQGGRDVYRSQGSESGGYGRDPYGRDNAREADRMYDRNAGGGRDEHRGGYGGGYGGRSGSSGYGGFSGGGHTGAGREDYNLNRDFGYPDYRGGDAGRNFGPDYNRDRLLQGRGYGGSAGGYGEGRSHEYGRDYGSGDYGRDRPRGRVEERGFWERAGDEVASWFGDDDAERRRHQDETRAAQNRGRGPRGYSRSDDRVREDINDRLTDDPYVDASDIDVSVNKGEVTLSGHIPHRAAKRRAEDIAESVSGVTHVQNNLRVRQPTATTTGAGASAMAGAGGTTGAGTGGVAASSAAGAGTRTTGRT